MHVRLILIASVLFALAFPGCQSLVTAGSSSSEDILIADFEGRTYGDWKAEGEAFGARPARGTLPDQQEVTGYLGRRLVNSYRGGDDSTGTLTSPRFRIQRRHINFLIGGGKYPGETCANLIIGAEVVRTATGPNDTPGGSEELDWHSWDVSELLGKTARIQIVDNRTGGWGHINIDHIYQSNSEVLVESGKTRDFTLDKNYLNFPVKNGARHRLISLIIDGEVVREFEIELANDDPDYWVFLEIDEFRGIDATLRIDKYVSNMTNGFDSVFQEDTFPGQEDLYKEKHRPQFHFSSRRGWNNDPNGMVYYDGEYHLFRQHNPYGWGWGNMTWGHAVSTDLVHWTELPEAIHPDRLGTIFSGSAVVDVNNTTGFQTGEEKPLVCIYTSAGGTNKWSEGQPFTQSIAYSNDRGRTWTVYENNPVQGHVNGGNRDPKVIWHEPTNQWVIVLYLDDQRMGFYTSKDLKSWEFQSELKCFHECPELFELPVGGDEKNKKWILYGASGEYFVGSFDGKKYTPETEAIQFNYGNCFYASQTFSDIPPEDGRRIQIAWGQVATPGMPFNQMMDFPVELTLHSTEEGVRMFAYPVKEIEKIHGRKHSWKRVSLEPGRNLLSGLEGDLFDISAEFAVDDADEVGFVIRGVRVVYAVEKQELSCRKENGPLKPVDGKIRLRILVDRTSIEIFGNDGRIYMPIGVIPDDDNKSIEVFTNGGHIGISSLEVYDVKSTWQ
jgi:fructan beta-fructosidase